MAEVTKSETEFMEKVRKFEKESYEKRKFENF